MNKFSNKDAVFCTPMCWCEPQCYACKGDEDKEWLCWGTSETVWTWGCSDWQLFPLTQQETEPEQQTGSEPDEDSDTEETLWGLSVSNTLLYCPLWWNTWATMMGMDLLKVQDMIEMAQSYYKCLNMVDCFSIMIFQFWGPISTSEIS